MKNQEREQARALYLQTNLTKTEIAEKTGINRRTIYQWSVDGDWDTIRTSARTMPSILAQRVYHIIGHFTDNILFRDAAYISISKDEVNTLAKLVNTLNKLKKGSTASENMETFTYFLEELKQKDAFLAEELLPHVDDFVSANAVKSHKSMLLQGYNRNGSKDFPEKEIIDKWQDENDYDAIMEEIRMQRSDTDAKATEGEAPDAPPAADPAPVPKSTRPATHIPFKPEIPTASQFRSALTKLADQKSEGTSVRPFPPLDANDHTALG
jgi:DNA-binding XRE family transcriptional regulator